MMGIVARDVGRHWGGLGATQGWVGGDPGVGWGQPRGGLRATQGWVGGNPGVG